MYNKDLKQIRILPARDVDPYAIKLRKSGNHFRISCRGMMVDLGIAKTVFIDDQHWCWRKDDFILTIDIPKGGDK